MRNKKVLRLGLLGLLATMMVASCSKEEDERLQEPISNDWTVRPDFATLDTRPQDVIASFTLTEKDAELVKPDENVVKGAKYALVIGISDYSGTQNDLQYCDDDATDWKNRLVSEGYSVTILLDGNATKSAIESAVNSLASKSIAGNEIAFCYSGHGSRGNIVTTDLYYISSSWFKTKFSTAKSTKMMFCFDACQIGAMKTALNATGRVIAVASSTSTYSYDGDASMRNGVFTYYQMDGFDNLSYTYLEPDCSYACSSMKSWASARRLKVAPSYADSYSGNFDL
jgi:hypothetical protein